MVGRWCVLALCGFWGVRGDEAYLKTSGDCGGDVLPKLLCQNEAVTLGRDLAVEATSDKLPTGCSRIDDCDGLMSCSATHFNGAVVYVEQGVAGGGCSYQAPCLCATGTVDPLPAPTLVVGSPCFDYATPQECREHAASAGLLYIGVKTVPNLYGCIHHLGDGVYQYSDRGNTNLCGQAAGVNCMCRPQTPIPVTPQPTLVPTSVPTPIPTPIPTSIPPTPIPTSEPQGEPGKVVPGSAGDALTAVSAAMGGMTARASLLAGGGSCRTKYDAPMKNESLPWSLHPTRMVLAESEWLGAVVGNLLICAAAAVFARVVLFIAEYVIPTTTVRRVIDTQGLLRLPSNLLFLFLILYQGTVLASLRMLMSGRSWRHEIFGLVGSVVCFLIPVGIVVRMMKSMKAQKGVYRVDKERHNSIVVFMTGRGEWVSTKRENAWVERYAVMVRPYTEKCVWWSILEFGSMFLLAVTSSVHLTNIPMCCGFKITAAVVILAFVAASIHLQPYHRPKDNILCPLINLTQGISVVFMSMGFCQNASSTHWTFITADDLLICSISLILLKLLTDILAEGYTIKTDRREVLQKLQYAETDETTGHERKQSLQHEMSAYREVVTASPAHHPDGIMISVSPDALLQADYSPPSSLSPSPRYSVHSV